MVNNFSVRRKSEAKFEEMVIESLRNYERSFFIIIAAIALLFTSCKFGNIGGASWDDSKDIEAAKHYPTTETSRILITTEEVPYKTFNQEFQNVFQDFPHHGNPIPDSSKITKAQIGGTQYSISYEDFALKIFRDGAVITERKLPEVFYMHPVSSGAILGKSPIEDLILCRTQSRATTGLHYIFIIDGSGEILFEKIMSVPVMIGIFC